VRRQEPEAGSWVDVVAGGDGHGILSVSVCSVHAKSGHLLRVRTGRWYLFGREASNY
jgi:hypothetical protein